MTNNVDLFTAPPRSINNEDLATEQLVLVLLNTLRKKPSAGVLVWRSGLRGSHFHDLGFSDLWHFLDPAKEGKRVRPSFLDEFPDLLDEIDRLGGLTATNNASLEWIAKCLANEARYLDDAERCGLRIDVSPRIERNRRQKIEGALSYAMPELAKKLLPAGAIRENVLVVRDTNRDWEVGPHGGLIHIRITGKKRGSWRIHPYRHEGTRTEIAPS